MDFSYSNEQKMLSDSAKTFFRKEWSIDLLRAVVEEEKGYSRELWGKMAALGWMGILVDEKYGGVGGTFMDLCPILETMGQALFPSPFFASAILAASILSKEANESIKKRLLASIAEGSIVITPAVGETGEDWPDDYITTRVEKNGGDYLITGTKLFVPYARGSDFLICLARDVSAPDSRVSLFLVETEADGTVYEPIPTFSIDKYHKVLFKTVRISKEHVLGKPGRGQAAIEKLWPVAAVGRCVEMLGGLQKVLDMTVQYVKEREQFGVPLGSFQVIQHRCAEMAMDVEASKIITYQAAWKISENLEARKEASMAKAWTGDAYQSVTSRAIQLHGAMGVTEEYDLQFYYKQAKSLQLMYGGSRGHRRIVAKETGY